MKSSRLKASSAIRTGQEPRGLSTTTLLPNLRTVRTAWGDQRVESRGIRTCRRAAPGQGEGICVDLDEPDAPAVPGPDLRGADRREEYGEQDGGKG